MDERIQLDRLRFFHILIEVKENDRALKKGKISLKKAPSSNIF